MEVEDALQDQELARKAQEHWNKGLEPQSKEVKYLKSYFQLKATDKLAKFQGELSQLREQYRNSTPEEFEQAMEETRQKYMDGEPSTFGHFFIPYSEQAMANVYVDYKKDQAEDFRTEVKERATSIARAELDTLIAENPENMASRIRQHASSLRARSKDLNVNPKEISEIMVELTGRRAVREGDPRLLEWFYKKDTSNVSIMDTELAEKASVYMRQAQQKAKALAPSRRKNAAYDVLVGEFTTAAGTDWVGLSRALADPDVIERLGLSFAEAREVQNFAWAQRTHEIAVTTKQKEDYKISVFDAAYGQFNDGNIPEAMETIRRSELPEKVKYDVIKGMYADQETNPMAYTNAVQDIISGKTTQESTILAGYGIKYTHQDGERLRNFLKAWQGPAKEHLKFGIQNIEKSMSKATAMQTDSPEVRYGIMQATMEFQDMVNERLANNEPVRPLVDPNNKEFVIESLVNKHTPAIQEIVEGMVTRMAGASTQAEREEVTFETFVSQWLAQRGKVNDGAAVRQVLSDSKRRALLETAFEKYRRGK